MEKTLKSEQSITYEFNKQPFCMRFQSLITGELIGELKEVNGVLVFNGNVDESAKTFFDSVIKCYLDRKKEAEYIPYQKCPICDGTGHVWNNGLCTNPYSTCPTCNGNRIIPKFKKGE